MRNGAPRRVLSLVDTTSLIVGIVVGSGIFVTAPVVARGAGSLAGVFIIWLVGAALSFFGALAYAELATAYPKAGGDYVYLSRAYGPWAGFLFGWIQTIVVRPGDIAVMAFVFATYAHELIPHPWASRPLLAAAAVVVLTGVNIAGVRCGVRTQNLLTTCKLIGVLVIIAVGLSTSTNSSPATPEPAVPLGLALILVLFTFGGWNEMALVAGEVRDPGRNIVRAMLLGLGSVTLIYLLLNVAFLRALGLQRLSTSTAVAADTVATILPTTGSAFVSAVICLCALGAINGLVFAGARISYAVGQDHRVFAGLGRWSSHTGTPVRALLLQGALSLTLIVTLGSFVDTLLYTAAPVYLFYFATSVAVMVLRVRDPATPRPYHTPGYPLTVIIFSAVCLGLIVSAVQYRPMVAGIAAVLVLLGLPAYWLSALSQRSGTEPARKTEGWESTSQLNRGTQPRECSDGAGPTTAWQSAAATVTPSRGAPPPSSAPR